MLLRRIAKYAIVTVAMIVGSVIGCYAGSNIAGRTVAWYVGLKE